MMNKGFVPAVLLSLSTSALALTGASASLTGLRYELVDLDLADGVTPYLKLTGVSQARAMLGPRCAGVCDDQAGSFTVPAFASRTWGDGVNSAFAAVSAAGLFASGHWDPSIGPTSNRSEYHARARYQGVPGNPLFVVSANTGLRITGQYTLDAFADPFRNPNPLLSGLESSGASVFFSSRFIEGPAPSRSVEARSGWPSKPVFAHETGEISVLLRNDLDHQATLWGKWGVEAAGHVPSVPEPSAWALMALGVALVGSAARRRHGGMPR